MKKMFIRIRSMLSEPFTRCLLLGGVIFGLSWVFDGPGYLDPDKRIHVTQQQISQIQSRYRLLAGRNPTAGELNVLINDFIDEEIAYRQAIALGLDKDDTVVRRRLRQKIMFITEDAPDLNSPSEQELIAWYRLHAEDFSVPELRSFRQRLYRRQGDKVAPIAKATEALANLNMDPAFEAKSDSTLLPEKMHLVTAQQVDQVFGTEISQAVFDAPQGDWVGPYESPYGVHLLVVDEVATSYLPPFEQIANAVRADWQQTQRAANQKSYMDKLRQEYHIIIDSVNVANAGV